MTLPDSIDELSWEKQDHPTTDELYLSGGLLVEDWPHARQVKYLAAQLFAATAFLHHLGEQELHLLERAALLHNAGMMIEVRRHHKHSFRLINETKLPDLSDEERYEVALIARYHRRALPSKEHDEFATLSRSARKRVSTLAALLRIVDALDCNHDGRVLCLSVKESEENDATLRLLLRVRPLADLDEELERAYEKADLFEKTFKLKVRFLIQE